MRLLCCLLTIIVSIQVNACTSNENEDGDVKIFSKDLEPWKRKGWKIVEVLGVEGKYISHTHLKSETARAINAFWVTSGKRQSKRYEQDKNIFLVVSFQKDDGDTFAVVMKKGTSRNK